MSCPITAPRPRSILPDGEGASGPDSFIPGKRVFEGSGVGAGDRDALAASAEAAGGVAGSGRRLRSVLRSVDSSSTTLESLAVLFHGLLLVLLS